LTDRGSRPVDSEKIDLDVIRVTAGGLRWRVLRSGDPESVPLLLLHGFTGRAEEFHEIARLLAGHRCWIPDLPGHGETDPPFPPEAWRMPRLAESLIELLDGLQIGRVDVAGYSMGGRAALHLALRGGDRVRRLILIGATAGIESLTEREARAAADMDLADLLIERGIEAFVDYWEAQPLFATQRSLPAHARARIRQARLSHDPASLSAALRAFGTGFQAPVHTALRNLKTPTLLVAGELDGKFRAIGESMSRLLPSAGMAIVPGAGHAVVSEHPDALAAILESFLSPEEADGGITP
jgi:2-succinyl-6-hydroxy-2,4-cyclohexadiene-1-carboxylate synthase